MHTVIAKIEFRALVAMLQYPGRARKVVHLVSNKRLLLLWTCPAPASKKHMLTHPGHATPRHIISVVLFHMLVFLPQKKKKKSVSSTQLPISRCLTNSCSYFKTQYRNHFPSQVFLTHPRLCSIISHTDPCYSTHHIYVLLSHPTTNHQ